MCQLFVWLPRKKSNFQRHLIAYICMCITHQYRAPQQKLQSQRIILFIIQENNDNKNNKEIKKPDMAYTSIIARKCV